MYLTRRVILELLRQFKLNQLKFAGKLPKMAEGTESSQLVTDLDSDTFHDVDPCNEISMLMNVT